MGLKSISFLSSRNQGMSADLVLTKNYLFDSLQDTVSFRYFVRSELKGKYFEKMGIRENKKEFCKKIEHCVCIDRSLSDNLPENAKKGKRIILAIPYSEHFKSVEDKNYFNNYTHIIAVSPYMEKRLKNEYEVDESKVISGVNSPLAYDITRENVQNEVKEQLLSYYPQMKGKRIVTVYYSGKVTDDTFFDSVGLFDILNHLGEECFILINNKDILKKMGNREMLFENRIGFVNNILPSWKLLYITDALITNNSMMMTTFASRRLPFYYIGDIDSVFGKYMKQNYKQLCMQSGDFENHMFDVSMFLREHDEFCKEFSYGNKANACETIKNLLTE